MPLRVKCLIALLALSNVATGVFAFYSLRTVDRRYSALVAGVVPALNELQTLTARATEAMRQTNPALILGRSADALDAAQRVIKDEAGLREQALRRPALQSRSAEREEFQRAGEAFTREAITYLTAAAQVTDSNELIRLREEMVRPAFARYLTATTSYADLVEVDTLSANDALSAQTSSLARVAFAAGNWPLGLVLLLTVTSVIVLVFVARSALFMPEERWRT